MEGLKVSGRDYCIHQVNNDAFVGRYVRRSNLFYFRRLMNAVQSNRWPWSWTAPVIYRLSLIPER
ncbi:hypothetical protein GCM10022627_02030 [Haloarcula argentinensis]